MAFTKFTSIEAFKNVWADHTRGYTSPVVEYQAKIKLHGTNAAIRVENSKDVFAQKRTSDVTPDADNAGFANWLEPLKAQWQFAAAVFYPEAKSVIWYGEWAGKGVQKTDAVSLLDKKYFFIFAIEVDGLVFNDPQYIECHIPEISNVLVIPNFYTDSFKIDFGDRDKTQVVLDVLDEDVENIGERDPFIFDIFEVEGPGEGLVVAPVAFGMYRNEWTSFIFKAKTVAHRVQKTKTSVSMTAEIPQEIREFVEMFVTEQRCEQGLSELGIEVVPTNTKQFVNWIIQDVRKESTLELEKMDLDFGKVAKFIGKKASQWWQEQSKKI